MAESIQQPNQPPTPTRAELDAECLRRENQQFAHTCGLSVNNARQNFIPAFRNEATGEVQLAKFADGRTAPMHLIINLPADWATARNARGQISAVLDSVVAGFVRDGQFYTRAEAAAAGE